MHRHVLIAVALATTALTAPLIAYPTSMNYSAGPTGDVTVRRRKHTTPAGARYRGKGQQAKAKRRRNMVTVSRRTRLKHRRAA